MWKKLNSKETSMNLEEKFLSLRIKVNIVKVLTIKQKPENFMEKNVFFPEMETVFKSVYCF